MSSPSLAAWLARLETLHPERIELGLARIRAVHHELGLQKPARCCICVAGTNGKGSVVRALQVLLAEPQANLSRPRVGLYTSPHLLHFNERIVIDGSMIGDAALCNVFDRIERARLATATAEAGPVTLTYFEFTTLAALCLFAAADLDYAILEVGLGGRLDAVNLVDADIAVITSIALDHEHWLGNTREAIAVEKAGILRAGKPCVIGDPDPPASLGEAVESSAAIAWWAAPAQSHCDPASSRESLRQQHPEHDLQQHPQQHAQQPQLQHGFQHDAKQPGQQLCWHGTGAQGESLTIAGLSAPVLDVANWSAALQVAALLGALPGPARCAALLAQTGLRGRQSLHRFRGRELLLDVAHNPAAVARLAEALGAAGRQQGRPVWLVFAALADKRIDAMLRCLMPVVDYWIFPQLHACPRALDADKMLQSFHAQGGDASAASISNSVLAALEKAVQESPVAARLCLSGSFFTVAEALAHCEPSAGPSGQQADARAQATQTTGSM